MRRLALLLICLLAAAPTWAQPRTSVLDLAFTLGQSHALRQLCQGADDQYWRARMTRMMDLETHDEASRTPLAERFNDGFRAARGQFSQCTPQSRAAERSTAARGRALALQLSAVGFR